MEENKETEVLGFVTVYILSNGTVDVQSPYTVEQTQELFKKLADAPIKEVIKQQVEAPEEIVEQEE
jgi:hypothetical protein